jgi:hypothetical protein
MAVHFTGPILYAGVNTSRKWFKDLPASVNPDYLITMDDFSGIALDATSDWTVVKDSGASAALGADAENGTLVLLSANTTDNDGASVQGNEIFAVSTGRDIWFETKCFVTDAEGSAIELCVGLTVNFATNPEAMLTAADRIVFQVDDGDQNIDCVTEKGGTETRTDSAIDIVSGTYVTLGFHVQGTGKVDFFVNRNLVATHNTNIPDDENLTVGAMSLSGSATGQKSSTFDYLLAAQSR